MNIPSSRVPFLFAAAILIPSVSPFALGAEEVGAGVTLPAEGATETEPWFTPTANIRARYEYGDTGGRNASNAETIRSRLGILSRAINGFQAFAEYEGTLAADRNSYQAASVSGLGKNKTIIADPESHELNQVWISYKGFDNLFLKTGRQEINLDNQRYVGAVGWRQNEQTFDAVTLSLEPREDLTLWYGYIDRVNRIFGSEYKNLPAQRDFEGNSHLVNVAYTGSPLGKITAYAYFLDLGNDAGDTNSSQSFGVTLSGKLPIDPFTYYLEYGYQTEAFDSPLDYGAQYAHAIITAPVCEKLTLDLGYEFLGSDNGVGYNFPLGTNHAFNGFADLFLMTPANGLQDIYASAGTTLPGKIKGKAIYHKFYDDDGSTDYGNEADLLLTRDLGKGFSVVGMYSYYWAGALPYTDTNRFSIEIDYKF